MPPIQGIKKNTTRDGEQGYTGSLVSQTETVKVEGDEVLASSLSLQ